MNGHDVYIGENMKTTRQTILPRFVSRLLGTLVLLSVSGLCLGSPAAGKQDDARKMSAVPALIEKNRQKKDVLLNAPQYNPEAKVYYLHYLSNIYSNADFNRATSFLAGLHQQMQGTGAELILYVNYTREDAARYQKARRYGSATNIPKRCRQLEAKCPIFNADKPCVVDTLFHNHKSPYGAPYTFSYPHLRAVDADGKVLAYFMLSGRSVRMILPDNRFSRLVVRNVRNEAEWITDAILATHSFLVKKAEATE